MMIFSELMKLVFILMMMTQQMSGIGDCSGGWFPPYWVGDCDIQDGCEFDTAEELFQAKIFDGQSIQERWEHLILVNVGGFGAEDWIDCYRGKFREFGEF